MRKAFKKIHPSFFLFFFILTSILCAKNANAYWSLSETADIIPMSRYQVGVDPQLLVNEGGGANLGAFGDVALNESTSLRLHIGAGTTDFWTGLSAKYTPFPDIDNQPAIGFRLGQFYARDNSENILSTQFAVLISKKMETEKGQINPYFAIPLTFISRKDENKTGTQVVFGTELQQDLNSPYKWGAELGLSLKDSASYILGTFSFLFDAKKVR